MRVQVEARREFVKLVSLRKVVERVYQNLSAALATWHPDSRQMSPPASSANRSVAFMAHMEPAA